MLKRTPQEDQPPQVTRAHQETKRSQQTPDGNQEVFAKLTEEFQETREEISDVLNTRENEKPTIPETEPSTLQDWLDTFPKETSITKRVVVYMLSTKKTIFSTTELCENFKDIKPRILMTLIAHLAKEYENGDLFGIINLDYGVYGLVIDGVVPTI